MSLMQYRINPFVQRLLRDPSWSRQWAEEDVNKNVSEWVPQVDIHEEKEAYVLTVEVPGVDPKDIHISAEGNTLTVRGEKKYEKTVDEKSFKRVECAYGEFFRQFTLPEKVSMDEIRAKSKHGVLMVRVPKHSGSIQKSIKIDVEE